MAGFFAFMGYENVKKKAKAKKENQSVRFLTGLSVNLSEETPVATVTLLRTGRFFDRRYGWFDITGDMLLSMVNNFEEGTFGQKIFIDKAHDPDHGAMAEVLALSVEGSRLRARVKFTEAGVSAVKKEGFIYLSAEFDQKFIDNETGVVHGTLLKGAALTIRPVIKRLEPIQLSEQNNDDHVTLVHPELLKNLNYEVQVMWKKLCEELNKQLAEIGLNDETVTTLCDSFTTSVENIAEEAAAKKLQEHFVSAGQQLYDQLDKTSGDTPISINIDGASGKNLSEEDVDKLVVEKIRLLKEEESNAEKKLQEGLDANVKLFNDKIDGAEGLKALSEEELTEIKTSAADLITANMNDQQVIKLAEHQIAMGNKLAVQKQLTQIGYQQPGAAGSVHITMDQGNEIKELQESIDKRVFSRVKDDQRYKLSSGKPIEENKDFVEEALTQFDMTNARRLHEEAANTKKLAAGDSVVSDVAIPAFFERTVLREALYQLTGLGLCDVGTAEFAAVAQIPYSYRDTTAAGISAARKYEGQSIARAAVKQALEEARPIPEKLSFEVSDELRYLAGNGQINFDIVAENSLNASRIIGEDMEQIIYNEQLNAADEYAVTAVSNEDLELQANGTNKVFVLAQWPVVRPRLIYDLQGAQVGSTLYPVTVTYNSVERSEYDGTGNQAAGIYYVLNYNLGEIYLVDEAGAIQTPTDTTAYTISYSATTNAHKWDSDLGSLTVEKKYNDFLYRFGARRTALEDRAYMATMGIMSGVLRDEIGQAEQFGANFKRTATDLASDGNVGRIKDVPTWRSFAPGLNAGDQRVVIGERRTTRFRMMRAWTMGELENQKDANGRFTGKKEAYGDQFIVVHTPTQLKGALTSMVVYSATARVARPAP